MNTSINLHQTIIDEIAVISEEANISKSEIVRMLIWKIKKINFQKFVRGNLIEYQVKYKIIDSEGCLISAYGKMHFSQSSDLCDYSKFLRYNYRISLSKLVAISFSLFWQEILNELFESEEKELDSYEQKDEYLNQLIEYFEERFKDKKINPRKRE